MKLGSQFYNNHDVLSVARLLIGKVLFSKINNQLTAGIITETEAYNGVVDKASHAYGGKRTRRTEAMYQKGGTAYIYLCYGIHSMFNVVSNVDGIPHAVLIRSVIPFKGAQIMKSRRRPTSVSSFRFDGPGKVSQALGIHYSLSGISLLGSTLWIEDEGIRYKESRLEVTPRIGVAYAGEDALLLYRFRIGM